MFEWKDSYSVGVPLIDEQHKKMFEIGNQVLMMLSRNEHKSADEFNSIMDVFDYLLEYTNYHFSQEEKLMAFYGYQETDAHIEEHKQFSDYLRKIDYLRIHNNPSETLYEILGVVSKWIFNHILQSDFKYKDHIVASMKLEQ